MRWRRVARPAGELERPDFAGGNSWIVPSHPRRDAERPFNNAWSDERRDRGAFGMTYRNFQFLIRYLLYEADPIKDAEWGPVRVLGAGSYGRVGLWQKRDENNNAVDELALKEDDVEDANTRTSTEADAQRYPRLLKEAVIQNELNGKDERAAPHLRRYKFFSADPAHMSGRYRSYLEFCPHDSLDRLWRLYRAWDTHVPEVFVWHVFHRLAISCEALRDPPPVDSLAWSSEVFPDEREEGYCLHYDIKPSNVLLDYAPANVDEHDFPLSKLSDYGLSLYSSYEDPLNPKQHFWRRTTAYAPPEQTSYGVHWKWNPTGGWIRAFDDKGRRTDYVHAKHWQTKIDNRLESKDDVHFHHATNIYGVGATMYSLIALRGDTHLSIVRAKSHQQYVRKGNHQISAVRTKKPGVYSSRLCQLVHRCIDPNPDARPTQLELLDATRRGLRLAERRLRRARRAGDPDNAPHPPPQAANAAAPEDNNGVPEHSEKLYFQGHEINDMPLGDANFRPKYSEVGKLVCDQFVNHDVRSLRLPKAKYGHFPRDLFIPIGNWKQMYDHSASGRLWCNDPLPQAQPQP
ncbi:hypothetical protein LTR99_008396 [Exophiala xenobiotica]|uniref:non-specific serine/threonine protein kinase n=1 Tax=Vermiconidia calcicola TaxID=1690605 RepID=A0AAV9Q3W3_9PEZI|nr:hypothetical protein LTR99_008396 [Exophiala xenobiotica]KAK5428813.1 hypothetical protein LTR34_007979 [Exophiala xenobiotica]KAK5531168.1 hypothetical protein LTR23_010082 [Chaetothyriales sp. CCFEE 6169]KAK5532786.1 hypothetical protein LTR25_007490 [Vermiconidia calcicola]